MGQEASPPHPESGLHPLQRLSAYQVWFHHLPLKKRGSQKCPLCLALVVNHCLFHALNIVLLLSPAPPEAASELPNQALRTQTDQYYFYDSPKSFPIISRFADLCHLWTKRRDCKSYRKGLLKKLRGTKCDIDSAWLINSNLEAILSTTGLWGSVSLSDLRCSIFKPFIL